MYGVVHCLHGSPRVFHHQESSALREIIAEDPVDDLLLVACSVPELEERRSCLAEGITVNTPLMDGATPDDDVWVNTDVMAEDDVPRPEWVKVETLATPDVVVFHMQAMMEEQSVNVTAWSEESSAVAAPRGHSDRDDELRWSNATRLFPCRVVRLATKRSMTENKAVRRHGAKGGPKRRHTVAAMVTRAEERAHGDNSQALDSVGEGSEVAGDGGESEGKSVGTVEVTTVWPATAADVDEGPAATPGDDITAAMSGEAHASHDAPAGDSKVLNIHIDVNLSDEEKGDDTKVASSEDEEEPARLTKEAPGVTGHGLRVDVAANVKTHAARAAKTTRKGIRRKKKKAKAIGEAVVRAVKTRKSSGKRLKSVKSKVAMMLRLAQVTAKSALRTRQRISEEMDKSEQEAAEKQAASNPPPTPIRPFIALESPGFRRTGRSFRTMSTGGTPTAVRTRTKLRFSSPESGLAGSMRGYVHCCLVVVMGCADKSCADERCQAHHWQSTRPRLRR